MTALNVHIFVPPPKLFYCAYTKYTCLAFLLFVGHISPILNVFSTPFFYQIAIKMFHIALIADKISNHYLQSL